VVRPYSTCELVLWSVVQPIVAVLPVIAEDVTPLMTGRATVVNEKSPDELVRPTLFVDLTR